MELKGVVKKINGKRKVSDLRGNLRQKTKGGSYYYRLTIANGQRLVSDASPAPRDARFVCEGSGE